MSKKTVNEKNKLIAQYLVADIVKAATVVNPFVEGLKPDKKSIKMARHNAEVVSNYLCNLSKKDNFSDILKNGANTENDIVSPFVESGADWHQLEFRAGTSEYIEWLGAQTKMRSALEVLKENLPYYSLKAEMGNNPRVSFSGFSGLGYENPKLVKDLQREIITEAYSKLKSGETLYLVAGATEDGIGMMYELAAEMKANGFPDIKTVGIVSERGKDQVSKDCDIAVFASDPDGTWEVKTKAGKKSMMADINDPNGIYIAMGGGDVAAKELAECTENRIKTRAYTGEGFLPNLAKCEKKGKTQEALAAVAIYIENEKNRPVEKSISQQAKDVLLSSVRNVVSTVQSVTMFSPPKQSETEVKKDLGSVRLESLNNLSKEVLANTNGNSLKLT